MTRAARSGSVVSGIAYNYLSPSLLRGRIKRPTRDAVERGAREGPALTALANHVGQHYRSLTRNDHVQNNHHLRTRELRDDTRWPTSDGGKKCLRLDARQ